MEIERQASSSVVVADEGVRQRKRYQLESGGSANSAVDMADKERGIIPLEGGGQAIELSCMTDRKRSIIPPFE